MRTVKMTTSSYKAPSPDGGTFDVAIGETIALDVDEAQRLVDLGVAEFVEPAPKLMIDKDVPRAKPEKSTSAK